MFKVSYSSSSILTITLLFNSIGNDISADILNIGLIRSAWCGYVRMLGGLPGAWGGKGAHFVGADWKPIGASW